MMNNTLSKIIVFAAGAAIGSLVTHVIVKAKYEREKEEEIQSVIESYNALEERRKEVAKNEARYEILTEQLQERKALEKEAEIKIKEEEEMNDSIYIITPEEFEETEYDTESLEWYEDDDTLVNQWGEVILERGMTVGNDFASHFGDYGEKDKDTVFVRNDDLEIDYEILRNHGCYEEPED